MMIFVIPPSSHLWTGIQMIYLESTVRVIIMMTIIVMILPPLGQVPSVTAPAHTEPFL